MFESGQTYDPRLLRETERLLRKTRYLREAWITPIAVQNGKVDLEVTTRDVWTLNPGISFGRKGGKNTSGFEIEELNLLGTGAQLGLSRRTGIDRTTDLLIYRDRQLGNTWWSVDTEFANNSDGKRRFVDLDHGFYALDTRRAGGLSFADDTRIDSRYDLGQVVGQYATRAKFATAYGGWSKGLIEGEVLRYRLGITQDERQFDSVGDKRPASRVPADRKLVYPWVSMEWLQDQFRETRNRDQIERTEDFQYGWQVSARIGYAAESLGSSENALLFDTAASRGIELDGKSTLLLSAHASGRHDGSDFVDTVIAGSARYYHRQSQRRLWFASLSLEQGHKLDPDRQILLGGDNAIVIALACRKRSIDQERLDQLISGIQRQVETSGEAEVPSSHIGELVMEGLAGLDPVAYVRYVSVYRQFNDVNEFIQEIQSLSRRAARDPFQRRLFKD